MSTAALPVHANNNSEFEGHVEARSGRIVEVKLDAREIMNGLRTSGDKVTDLVKSCRAAWDFEGCPWIEAECDRTGTVGDKQLGELKTSRLSSVGVGVFSLLATGGHLSLAVRFTSGRGRAL